MNDVESGGYVPGEVAQRLFYTDLQGEPTDPDDAITDALDGAWQEREPEAAALLADEDAAVWDRFLALSALTRWGSPRGYAAVRAVAADPDAQPWRDASVDRMHSLDNTFGLLAADVQSSLDMVEDRGSAAERLQALAALIGLNDRVYFEHCLSPSGLLPEDVEALRGPIEAAIEHGLGELASAAVPLPAWVHEQVAELIASLGQVDKAAADAYQARLGG